MVSFVRVERAPHPGELAHRPELPAVHRRIHAAREGKLARIAEVTVKIEIRQILRRVQGFYLGPGGGRKTAVTLLQPLIGLFPLVAAVLSWWHPHNSSPCESKGRNNRKYPLCGRISRTARIAEHSSNHVHYNIGDSRMSNPEGNVEDAGWRVWGTREEAKDSITYQPRWPRLTSLSDSCTLLL